jgi:hypothetical protein
MSLCPRASWGWLAEPPRDGLLASNFGIVITDPVATVGARSPQLAALATLKCESGAATNVD